MSSTQSSTQLPPLPNKPRVLVVEDHPIVRHGLTQLIDDQPDLCVCGSAADIAAALQLAEQAAPDVAVVDLSLGNESGLDLIARLRTLRPGMPVLVLSMHDESAYAERALRAGARGYVMKREAMDQVLTALRQVLAGGLFVSASVSARLVEKAVSRPTTPLDMLSDREFEIFRLLAAGTGPSELARRLNLSVKTIEAHREHIKAKLGVKTAAELARVLSRWADRQG